MTEQNYAPEGDSTTSSDHLTPFQGQQSPYQPPVDDQADSTTAPRPMAMLSGELHLELIGADHRDSQAMIAYRAMQLYRRENLRSLLRAQADEDDEQAHDLLEQMEMLDEMMVGIVGMLEMAAATNYHLYRQTTQPDYEQIRQEARERRQEAIDNYDTVYRP